MRARSDAPYQPPRGQRCYRPRVRVLSSKYGTRPPRIRQKQNGPGRGREPWETGTNFQSEFQAIEHGRLGLTDGYDGLISRCGAEDVEPRVSRRNQADAPAVGLRLQGPADVIGGPAQGKIPTAHGGNKVRRI